MATPPTFVADREGASWDTTTSPKTTGSFDIAVNDAMVAVVADENDNGDENYTTTNTGTGLTWTEKTESSGTSNADGWVQAMTAVVAGAQSGITVSATRTAGTASKYGVNVVHFSGSDGIGASATTSGVGGDTPSLSITTSFDNSAIVYLVCDFNAADGTMPTPGHTHRTVNGFTPTAANGQELTYFRNNLNYTIYVAYIPDAGAAGAKSVGISAPSGQDSVVTAVEVRGSAAAAAAADGGPQFLRPGFMAGAAFPAFMEAPPGGWSPADTAYDAGLSGPQAFLSDLTAALDFTGAQVKQTAKGLAAATVSFTGSLARRTLRALAATLAFTGTLGTAAVHNFTQALTATLSFTGAQTRRVGKATTATVSFTGTQARSVAKGVTATVSFTGAQARRTATALSAAALSFTGAMVKRTSRALSATVSFTGSVATLAVHVFTQALTATLAFTGSLPRRMSAVKTATVAFTATQARSVAKGVASALSFAGSLPRRITSSQTATASFTATTTRRTARSLTATLSFTGSLATLAVHFFTQALSATVGFSGTVARRTGRSVSAAVGFTAGALTRRIGSSQSATVGFVGGMRRAIGHRFTAAVGFVGNLLGLSSGVPPPDPNPITMGLDDDGHEATVRARRTRLTLRRSGRGGARAGRTRLTLDSDTTTNVQEND